MSRHTVRNERFEFAFGLDHVCGPWLQVWDHDLPEDDEGAPQVDIDNLGIRLNAGSGQLPHPLLAYLGNLVAAFELTRNQGVANPYIGAKHAIDISRLLGFEGLERRIFAAWDDPP